MSPSYVLIAVFAYIFLLFGLARLGDRQQFVENSPTRHPLVYALALGVYCTSWTFYGLVGTASEKGWNFLPILLGPILLFTLGYPILERIRHICRQEHIHSIADFIAARYGRRQGVAATVSLVSLLATIPYIALQLKAVSDTLVLTIGNNIAITQDLTLIIAISMIVFALLFGAKRLDVSGYHSGLMSAVAFESLVKLFVLMTIAAFAISWLRTEGQTELLEQSISQHVSNQILLKPPSWLRFFIETLLSICAIFCLPRMFHVTFVECLSPQHLKQSRWWFSAYLIVISFCVFIIAWVGNTLFYGNSAVNGDSYVIALPLLNDSPALALVAFLGGFSAATAMIIVATITLSQMLSNDVILPILVRRRKDKKKHSEFSRSLIISRRTTVIFVVLGAYLYQSILAENAALTSIGLIAFALVVQLAPAILFGLYWRKGNANGLYAGLIVGTGIWFYTLMIPLLAEAGLASQDWVSQGLLGLAWLRPEYLFGLHFGDSFTRGVILSLLGNVAFYCWYSLTGNESFSDRVQATAFTSLQKAKIDIYDDIDTNDLRVLLKEFLGEPVTESIFQHSQIDQQKEPQRTHRALVEDAQRALAGTVGVASAQTMIEGLRSGKKMAMEEVVSLFGETTKALRFNQEVLFSSFENISSGISVVDQDLNLVAWNQRYEKMFDYPKGLLKVGLHVADIMRFNGERGLLGEGNVDDHIRKRISLMSSGKVYRVVRFHSDDTIIEIKGMPLPNGGYVTTYDDITQFITAQRQLEDANENLEKRVQERTQTIAEINHSLLEEIERRGHVERELRHAKKMADEASASKTKFLALASHDIMQPLNAASLYASALAESETPNKNLVLQLRQAIQNTETIISSLLEISKVDNGAISPRLDIFLLDDLLANLISEAMVQRPRTLDIRYCATSLSVVSDKHYLRRILQNLISNAVKYTQSGKVLVGARRRTVSIDGGTAPYLEICVIDNGPGIPEQELNTIFNEFYRSERQQLNDDIPGIGLGLSVVKRFSDLLGHPIKCHSVLHRGSLFSILVPVAEKADSLVEETQVSQHVDQLEGLRVVYVDDDPQNLLATSALLEHWGCCVHCIDNVDEALSYARANSCPQVLLMDFQLGDAEKTGLDLAEELRVIWQLQGGKSHLAVCIVSAANQDDLPINANKAGFEFLSKPIKPAKLRALLTQFSQRNSLV